MSKKLKLNCGCEFEAECNENGDIISLNYDPENVRMDCIKTWNLLAEGNTLGTFQLHTKLGQSLASKVQPYCIEELSDLISIMRPGCMDAIIGDKSLTEHYIERKHGREKVEPIHPALGESTKDTQGIMCYQEQVIAAAKTLAGFDNVQGRQLQKAMGKKKPELMAKLKQQFVDGCKERGIVNEVEAQEVFDAIEANQRYSFCKCLSPQTLVEKEGGQFVSLDEIEIGDKILDHNGDYTEVLDVIESGDQELYEFETESGVTIQCTLSHKFLCEDGEVREMSQILDESHNIMTID